MSAPTPRPLATPIDAGARTQHSDGPEAAATAIIESLGLRVASASATGTRHTVNEDACSALERAGRLFVVADGVGGGAFAAFASRDLVAHLHAALDDACPDADLLRTTLLDADRAIARSIASRTDASGAATVVLCMAADASLARWLIAWVGDCRAYRLRHGSAPELLTRDDTYLNLGQAVPSGGAPEDPARMVGNGAVDVPNVIEIQLAPGDTLVLCSDGVHKHVADAALQTLRHGAFLADRCARLIATARANGSRDDATVLAIERPRRMASAELRGVQP